MKKTTFFFFAAYSATFSLRQLTECLINGELERIGNK
jgi:hypothetical protein